MNKKPANKQANSRTRMKKRMGILSMKSRKYEEPGDTSMKQMVGSTGDNRQGGKDKRQNI